MSGCDLLDSGKVGCLSAQFGVLGITLTCSMAANIERRDNMGSVTAPDAHLTTYLSSIGC
jgi:hypothetical protein